jgi:glycosyltransferase involved in cell wall biosynthesis
MDVFALPSRTTPTWKEQFGRVIIEAMACAVPVVGSDSGQIPHLIRETGGGVVFHEGDVEDFTAKLLSLVDDPAGRRRMGMTGRAVVQERYTFDAIARQLHRICGESIQRRSTAQKLHPAPALGENP